MSVTIALLCPMTLGMVCCNIMYFYCSVACNDGDVRLVNNGTGDVEYITRYQDVSERNSVNICKYNANLTEVGNCTVSSDLVVGRVEICVNNVFGTVCDDRWDKLEAKIVCRQLGIDGESKEYYNGHI